MNTFAIVGEIIEKPELKELNTGVKLANLMVRVKRAFPNSQGVYEYDKFNVTLWRGIAESCNEIASVGDCVAIKGRLQSREITSNEGNNYIIYDIIAEHVSFLSN